MAVSVIKNSGCFSGSPSVIVFNSAGLSKYVSGCPSGGPAVVAWGSITGLITNQTDLVAYISSEIATALLNYVPITRVLTINGVSYDLSADRTWTISTGGGGSGKNYYLNGGINQGVFVGNTYYEMNPVPIVGSPADFTISSNGYISQFITDVGDPNQTVIPAGNWNFELWFSASSSGGSPNFYVELYKYDGVSFTLLSTGSASPEGITNGTTIDLYTTAIAVPQTVLLSTDRLAVRVWVNNSGRTITLHTQDSHLCQIITTFPSGIVSLNGLEASIQNFSTGSSGTDFNISSSGFTHTFNIPTASAVNRGLLSTTDWLIFNNKQTAIQFEDEGVALGTAGTVDEYDVVGQMHKATRTGNKVTHQAPSVGENLVLPSLDPVNSLYAQIGAFSPNSISWTTTGKQNNLSLTGWNDAWSASAGTGKATIIIFSGASYAICSGVVGGSNGRIMIITNTSNKLVILENESTDSSVANRFRTMDGLACFLMPNESAVFMYYDSRWNMIEKQRWDIFDDFTGWAGAATQPSNTFYLSGISTTASGLTSQQLGLISMQPAAASRSYALSFNNGAYGVSGTSTPTLVVSRVAFSSSISTFGRLAIGFGNMAASAGNFYLITTGVCNGALWGFASDSGIANASTNFFLYSGTGGAANITAQGLDSGIPISNAVNNYNNFVVFLDTVNNVYEFFYSRNNGVYQYVGQRTQTPTSGTGAIWYEGTNASRPTMWIDYIAQKTKVIITR